MESRRLMEDEPIYIRACITALCGEIETALELLSQALLSGEETREWVRQDPDWEDFHSDERWIALTES